MMGLKQGVGGDLTAARREGKVVVAASPHAEVRKTLPSAFEQRFGIALEYLGGRSSDTIARLQAERQAGTSTIDVLLSGIDGLANVLYPGKMLDPLRPALTLPEVLDTSKWKKGKLWFMDPEEKYILRLFNVVSAHFHINTQHVNPMEFRSAKDLLNPKFRGKISVTDPTITTGSGSSTAPLLYREFGEDFIRRLYIDQRPAVTDNPRDLVDWLARGTYPISLTVGRGDVRRLKEAGFPVMTFFSLPDLDTRVTAGNGLMALLNRAPHPNAARVFLNWIASREGLEVLSRAYLYATTRNDVDESFLLKEEIPQPGVTYFDSYDWEWTLNGEEKAKRLVKEALGSR